MPALGFVFPGLTTQREADEPVAPSAVRNEPKDAQAAPSIGTLGSFFPDSRPNGRRVFGRGRRAKRTQWGFGAVGRACRACGRRSPLAPDGVETRSDALRSGIVARRPAPGSANEAGRRRAEQAHPAWRAVVRVI